MSDNSNIPFLDLASLHTELEPQLLPIFQKVLRNASFIGGPLVEGFERDFAKFCDAAHCIGVASGTDAVRFALMAAGVKPGDIAVTVPHTFIATTEAISQAGARPDFVDVDKQNHCLDPIKLQEYIDRECEVDAKTGKLFHRKLKAPVTAVVPVHIYGQTADMDPILDIARRHHLIVVEDACQAHGAEYFSKAENRWKKAGSMGHAAAFSFYPGKNLGACGEGGAVTTNDEAMAKYIRMLRDHGQSKKYYHEVEGYNGRLDSLQAGMLQVKLGYLADWNAKRRECAARYNELLAEFSDTLSVAVAPAWTRSVYHLFVVRTSERDKLQEHLTKAGIGTGIHYPIPVHLQNAYKSMGFKKGDFPVAESVAAEVLSLPMYPGLTAAQQKRVVDAIAQFAKAEDRVAVQS